jgi:two-component system NtrC family sensor kinase
VALNEVLRSALALQAYQLRIDNIAVQLDLDPNLTPTVADPHQLQQVFLNLITNARHAMVDRGERGNMTLRTSVASASDGTPVVRVEIADSGVGIPERNLQKIFNPFFTTKPVGQGTGLGLSICFGIVKEHDGQIWAESQIGVGTHVYVDLPIRVQDVLEADLPAPTHSPADEPEPSLNILVVDDEEPVVRLMARLLGDLGHHSTVATSGEAALEILSREVYDIILCDVKMPSLSGFAFVAAIRERDPDLADRVIFVTGDTLSPNTRTALEASGNLFLAKPFSIEQLDHTLQSLVKRRSIGTSNV